PWLQTGRPTGGSILLARVNPEPQKRRIVGNTTRIAAGWHASRPLPGRTTCERFATLRDTIVTGNSVGGAGRCARRHGTTAATMRAAPGTDWEVRGGVR